MRKLWLEAFQFSRTLEKFVAFHFSTICAVGEDGKLFRNSVGVDENFMNVGNFKAFIFMQKIWVTFAVVAAVSRTN